MVLIRQCQWPESVALQPLHPVIGPVWRNGKVRSFCFCFFILYTTISILCTTTCNSDDSLITELWFLRWSATVKISLIALLVVNNLKWLVKLNIFYSGVLGLWLGVCSPEQPLVPTGVKSPSSVSGRTEAVKRGLHSSIFANQWKHFLSPCPPHALKGISITAMCVIHSCVSWLLVNERFQVWCYGERSCLRGSKPHFKWVNFSCFTKNPGHGYGAILGINAQGLTLKPSNCTAVGSEHP